MDCYQTEMTNKSIN